MQGMLHLLAVRCKMCRGAGKITDHSSSVGCFFLSSGAEFGGGFHQSLLYFSFFLTDLMTSAHSGTKTSNFCA